MRVRPSRPSPEAGQASAELIAVTALLLVLVLVVAQAAVVGYTLWTAGEAARAGARAAHVGGEPEEAARSALPTWLERRAEVDAAGPVEVRVSAPPLLPGIPAIAVVAATALGPEPGGG
jgi:hypothetical protein